MFHDKYRFDLLLPKPTKFCVCSFQPGKSQGILEDISCAQNAVTTCTKAHRVVSGNSCLPRHRSRRSVHRRPKIPKVRNAITQHSITERVSIIGYIV